MRKPIKLLPLFFSLLLITSTGWAQKAIEGTVRDAKTGETLPSANIVIKDVYRGTITNRDGSYSLSIPDSLLPATIRVSFIGYHSQEKVIDSGSSQQQNFDLQPAVMEMEELVVTDEDPAIRIMRRVIEKKEQWRSKLETYRAQAYTRQNLSNDTAMVMITESASEVYWSKEKGNREVLKWRKQTANIEADQNFAGVSYLPNFYDDNIEIAGFDVVGVTNPKAFSYYDFKLLGRLTMDGQEVYHIKVIPERDLQPLFEGEVYVLDNEYALLKVDLAPNSVVRFPPPIKNFELSYTQQYSNYGGDFWLPVDARIEGSIKISMMGLRFPEMQLRQLAKISSYDINVPLPDSLYEQDDLLTVDTTAVAKDSIGTVLSVEPVPLSEEEKHAYATLDSTQTLEKAFKPSGFLARFVDMDDEEEESGSGDNGPGFLSRIPGSFSPRGRYNRVDELFVGLNYAINPVGQIELSGNGGYSTGYGKWSYGGEAGYSWNIGRFKTGLKIGYQAQTAPRYHSQTISPLLSSVSNLFGYENYFDYFREEGVEISGSIRDRRSDVSLKAIFKSADQSSLQTQTGYDIAGRDNIPRVNPGIDEGHLNSLNVEAGYDLNEGFPFGVIGRNRIEFDVEVSDDALGSDFNFARYSTHIDWHFDTFYKRRFLPNTLDVSLDAGTFSGQLPLQQFGIVDVAPSVLSLFEGLRTVRFRPYEGEQYAVLNLEHNFRTIPFERVGLTPLVDRNIGMIVFAGAAKTWVSDQRKQQLFNKNGYIPNTTGGMHLEAGVSLTGIFDLFRVDFAQRLDEPAFLIGIGITRFN